jgi:uncharacterized protein YjiS (DUF1127 family)
MKAQKGYAIAPALPGSRQGSKGLFARLWMQVKRWNQLAAERRLLASMPDATLKDLGLSRSDVEQEVQRPFWDDPLSR